MLSSLLVPTASAQTPPLQYVNLYTYDPVGRLMTASQSAAEKIFEYTYDSAGNRTTSEVNDVVSNYSYNNDNQLTVNDSTAYTHDNKGNQTVAGSKTFEYNFDNKLTKYIEPAITTEYKYDGVGNRLSQKVGSVTTQFVNDVSGDLTKVLVAKNTSTSTSNYFVQGLGSTLSEGGAANTARQYYVYDGMGNVRFATDNTGAKLQYLSYDPYGNPLGGNGTDVFQYKGEQTDQGGMYFMRARYYDPTTGRFISKDPVDGILTNPQSQNGYNFANVNPVNLSDPSGEQVAQAAALGGGVLAACTLPISGPVIIAGTVLLGTAIIGGYLLDQAQNPTQDKRLTEGEIKRLQEGGEDIHEIKNQNSGQDLFKKPDGEIIVKPKNGAGDGETTGLNIKDY